MKKKKINSSLSLLNEIRKKNDWKKKIYIVNVKSYFESSNRKLNTTLKLVKYNKTGGIQPIIIIYLPSIS